MSSLVVSSSQQMPCLCCPYKSFRIEVVEISEQMKSYGSKSSKPRAFNIKRDGRTIIIIKCTIQQDEIKTKSSFDAIIQDNTFWCLSMYICEWTCMHTCTHSQILMANKEWTIMLASKKERKNKIFKVKVCSMHIQHA